MLQHPKIWAFRASSSFNESPLGSAFLSWDCVTLFVVLFVSAKFSLDLSINAAILFGSNNSFFSNSETCLTSVSIFSGFCFFSSIFFTFSIFSFGNGTASGFSFFIFFGGACSETTLSVSSFFIFSIIFFAFGANGMLVLSVIWINSTDIIGGSSIGVFNRNGRLSVVIIITIKWKPVEIIIFLFTLLPFFVWLRN